MRSRISMDWLRWFVRSTSFASVLALAGACSPMPNEMPGDSGTVRRDSGSVTEDSGGAEEDSGSTEPDATPRDSGGSSGNDLARVQAWCEKVFPACGQSVAQCVDVMRRTQNPLCEERWVAEVECVSTLAPSDLICTAGEPNLATAQCRDTFLRGARCRIATADPDCYGARCMYDSDCPGDQGCNDRTGHCFNRSAGRSCAGLPCRYEADCPTGLTCNDAEGLCVVR